MRASFHARSYSGSLATTYQGRKEYDMARLPDNTPQILRQAGLKVTVLPGWKTRGRPASTGGFDPVGVLCHHTATGMLWAIAAVLRLLTGGRTGLPGPLCQFGLGRDGRVYLVAAGRANHAGEAKASGSVAAGDGNTLYIGIEAFNDGIGEKWPDAQYNAYVLLAATLSVFITKSSSETVRGHKETSVTGKIDPTFNMPEFRRDVDAMMKSLQKAPKAAKTADLEVLSWNVYSGTSPARVRAELGDMIHEENPDVIFLYEGVNLYGHLTGLGYRVFQLKPKSQQKGSVSNNGNIVGMVRNGLKVRKSFLLRMKERWFGPKHGLPQDPRVYRSLKVSKKGIVFKTGGFHLPFGKEARAESVAAVKKFFAVTRKGRPVIAAGDWQTNEADTYKHIARPVHASVTGDGVDLAIYMNCTLVEEKNLGKRSSDHPAMLWRFRARKAKR